MFTEMFVFLLGAGLHVEEIRDLNRKDKEMMKYTDPRPLQKLNEVHEILSCLIKGVYASDKFNERVEAYQYWTSVGYEHVKLDVFNSDQQLTSDRVKIGDLQGRNFAEGDARRADLASVARMMLFRRSAKCSDKGAFNTAGGGPDRRIPLPEYVVAIRGTIIQSNRRSIIQNIRHEEDIWADAKVVSEVVHAATDLYEPVFRLVLAIYQQCGPSVWVTGHSLGAMIALLATRKLALSEEKIVLPTHLFNQPNVSLDILTKFVVGSSIKGFKKYVVRPFVSKQIQEALGECWNEIDAKFSKLLRKGTEKIAAIVAPNYGEQLTNESRDLVSTGYSPYLYVNPNDPICSEYIRHFRVSSPAGLRATSPSAIMSKSSVVLQMLSVNAYTSHLVPQGHLIINNWALGPKQAHKLHQWYLYPTKDLQVHRVPVSAE